MDSQRGQEKQNDAFLKVIFDQILWISRGESKITKELISGFEDKNKMDILLGLELLYEDLELYKKDFRSSVQREYQLKVLEERNKELERFNYVASHDLQAPLNTIKSFVVLIKERLEDKMDDDTRQYLDYIVQSTGRMSDLIFGLLNYSRLGNDTHFDEVNIQQVVADVLLDLNARIKESNAEIFYGKLPTVIANELSMRQLFQNLIGNGLKFIPKEKQARIFIDYEVTDDVTIFSVKDNGIGIKDEDKEKVFKIFQRLETKTKYQGTGIGLAVCQKIIEIHNGKIWLESTFGEGTTFFFSIPK